MNIAHSAKSPGGPTLDFSGRWENQMGSTMSLQVNGASVTGTYITSDSSSGAEARGKLTGAVDGDLIAFVVNWEDYLSLSAWTGQLVGDTIQTLWHVVHNVEDVDEPKKLWTSTLAGADRFTKII